MGSPDKPNIFQRSLSAIQAIGIWLLFFIVCFLLGGWAFLFIYYDWKIILFWSIVGGYWIFKGIRRLWRWLDGRDDRKIEQKLGSSADTTPLKDGKKPDFIPPSLVVGENEVKKDIYESIISFLQLYGELNYRDENTLKRVMEACIFRTVTRGELEFTLHAMHRAKIIYVKDHIITLEDPSLSIPEEKLYPGVNRLVWNINLLLIQIHGFDKFHKESDEIFNKYNISDLPRVMETLKESADFSKSKIMFYHFDGQKKKPGKNLKDIINTVKKESKVEEIVASPPPKDLEIELKILQEEEKEKKQKIDAEMSPKLRNHLAMIDRLAQIDKEFEANAGKE